MADYEVCVIGAGSAGVAAASAAEALGKRVLLVTGAEALGGTCILRGCMPAKTVLSATERLGDVLKAHGSGVRDTEHAGVDLAKVIARKRELVDYFAADRIDEISQFERVRADARFTAIDTIDVRGRAVSAERFIVATGSRIDPHFVPCLQPDDYFTSDDALEMTAAPHRLVVIGGGPVGCEFAQYFARLGSAVTLLQEAPELLRNEDADIGAAVRNALIAEGIRVVCAAAVLRCDRVGERRQLSVGIDGGVEIMETDAVMLATGRRPNVASLGLDAAEVRTDERSGGIAVDAFLASSNPRVYAAGDVIGRRCLVHVAVSAGTLAAHNACGPQRRAMDFARYESHAVYVQPQLAVAGLTEREARAHGLKIRVRRHPFEEIGKAVVSDESRGFVKMIADDEDRIRGIAIFGDEGVELAGEALVLVDRGVTLAELIDMPHLHPTMSEIFVRAAEDFARPSA